MLQLQRNQCSKMFFNSDEEQQQQQQTVMDLLLSTENHLLLSRVFLQLDPSSLRSCARVCKRWRAAVKREVWGARVYRNKLRKRLQDKWNR